MTPKEKAVDLKGNYIMNIHESDFHIPRFISGIKCANGSKKYNNLYNNEVDSLATRCALVSVDEILEMAKNDFWLMSDIYLKNKVRYYEAVREEIIKLK